MAILNTQSLPTIIKLEALHRKLNEKEAISERKKTTLRIVSLLGVKFSDNEEKGLSVAEYGSFLNGYNLTGAEVVEAYRMALRKEFDYKVYPTLSVIQCGEILDLYQDFKRKNVIRQKFLKDLQNEQERREREQKIDLEKVNFQALKMVFDEVKAFGYTDKAHIVYKDLDKKNLLRTWDNQMKKRFLNYVNKKIIQSKKNELWEDRSTSKKSAFNTITRAINSNKSNIGVYKCQSIFVCDFLRKVKDFESLIVKMK